MSEFNSYNNNHGEESAAGQNEVLYGTVQQKAPKKKGGAKIMALVLCAALLFGAGGYAIGARGASSQEAAVPVPETITEDGQELAASGAGQEDASSRGFSLDVSSLTNGRREMEVSELVKQYKDTTVLITSMKSVSNKGYGYSFGGSYFPFGSDNSQSQEVESALGSGVVVSSDGYIITNNHVVEGASSVKVTMSDNTTYDAQVVGTDEQTDIAVLKIEASGLKFAVLGDSDALEVGQTCVAIGNPLGNLTGTVTTGIISALERTITVEDQTMTLLQHDAAINEGNSGGPLFNLYGEVIGINNAKTSALGVEGIGFAIPSNTVKEVAEDLINNGYVTGRPKIGITVQTISEAQAQYYGVVAGVGVVSVESGSPAEKAGLVAGDIITQMNDQEVLTLDDLDAVKNSCKVGDTVSIEVYRNGQNVKLTLVLGEDKPESAKAYNGGWNADLG